MKQHPILNGLVTGWVVGSMGLGTYSPRLYAATYYVSPTGNNASANATSAATPWKTLTHAVNQATAGDMLVLLPGTYDTANGETFPIAVKSGVTVQGGGADTAIVALGTIFSVSGDVTDAWLSGLTLTGGASNPLVQVSTSEGDNVELTLSEIGVAAGSSPVMDLSHVGGEVTFHPTFENNTITGRTLLGISNSFSGAVELAPVFQGNTLSGNAGGFSADLNLGSGWMNLMPTFMDNSVTGGGYGLSINVGGSGAHTPTQGVALNVVLSGNTFSGSESGLNATFSSVSGMAISTMADLHHNQLEGAFTDLAQLSYQNLYDVTLARNVTVSENSLTSESSSVSGQLVGVYEDNLFLAQVESRLTLAHNTVVNQEQGLEYYVQNLSNSRYSSTAILRENNLTGLYQNGFSTWLDAVFASYVERATYIEGNALTGVGDPIELGLYSIGDSILHDFGYISGNTVEDTSSTGIAVYNGNIDGGMTHQDITLTENTISGLDSQGIYLSMYSIESGNVNQTVAVTGNTISDTAGSGIQNYISSISSSRFDQNMTISDNTITNSGENGIEFELSYMSSAFGKLDYSIHNNTISGSEATGIYAWHYSLSTSQVEISNVISQNTISNVANGSGIQLSFSSMNTNAMPVNFEMHDNTISAVEYSGIYVNAYDFNDQSGPITFTATGNTITDAGSTAMSLSFYAPSTVTGPLKASFSGNEISGAQEGIHLGMSNGRSVTGDVILEALNNRVTDTTVGITASVSPAADTALSLYTTLSGNRVSGAADTGIQALLPTSSSMQRQWVEVDGNVVQGAGETGIYLAHAGPDSVVGGGISVSDNLVTGGAGTGMHMHLTGATRPLVKASGNTVTGNVVGVMVAGMEEGGSPDFGGGLLASVGNNHIADNRSVASDGTLGPLDNFVNETQAQVFAKNNFWNASLLAAIDLTITDNEEGAGEVVIDPVLASAPLRAGIGTVQAYLVNDVAPFGPSANDTVGYVVSLANPGTAGCAATEIHADLGPGAMMKLDSGSSDNGTHRLTEGHADFWMGTLDAGEDEVYVAFDVVLTGSNQCLPVTIEVSGSCESEGDIDFTTSPISEISTPFSIPVASTWYADGDGDGFGTDALVTCDGTPLGYAALSGDCNDENTAVNPAAEEQADDGVDTNCDGHEVCFIDADGDGFRPDTATQHSTSLTCTGATDGKSTDPVGDCNDADATAHATQIWFTDADEDGVGETAETLCVSDMPTGYAAEGGDNCPADANATQADADEDGWGDACDISWQDSDDDGDGVVNGDDNCPAVKNANQDDLDEDGFGDACDSDFGTEDSDDDGLLNYEDSCPTVANAGQEDLDEDGIGDACDLDADGDTVNAGDDCDDSDDTVSDWTWAYADGDSDLVGDSSDFMQVCGSTLPEGYTSSKGDNCPDVANTDQADADADGLGDACDVAETPDGVVVGGGGCSVNPGASPENATLNLLALAALLLPALRRRRRQNR